MAIDVDDILNDAESALSDAIGNAFRESVASQLCEVLGSIGEATADAIDIDSAATEYADGELGEEYDDDEDEDGETAWQANHDALAAAYAAGANAVLDELTNAIDSAQNRGWAWRAREATPDVVTSGATA